MKRTKEMPSVKELQKVIFNPKVTKQLPENVEALRIDTDESGLTRIDFIYHAPAFYENGGWVQMSKHCFIRPCGTNLKLTLVKAINIPITPRKYFFRKKGEILCYTLLFPPLPKGTTSIDIIESQGPGGDWFNFFGVSLEKIKSQQIMVNNN